MRNNHIGSAFFLSVSFKFCANNMQICGLVVISGANAKGGEGLFSDVGEIGEDIHLLPVKCGSIIVGERRLSQSQAA